MANSTKIYQFGVNISPTLTLRSYAKSHNADVSIKKYSHRDWNNSQYIQSLYYIGLV